MPRLKNGFIQSTEFFTRTNLHWFTYLSLDLIYSQIRFFLINEYVRLFRVFSAVYKVVNQCKFPLCFIFCSLGRHHANFLRNIFAVSLIVILWIIQCFTQFFVCLKVANRWISKLGHVALCCRFFYILYYCI